MKRDMDLIREILLTIEAEGDPELPGLPELPSWSAERVVYHVRLLREAGLVNAVDASTLDGEDYIQVGMSWGGHEFLEKVRDSEVWIKTKASAAKVGSFSISLIAELAKAALLSKAQSLGFIGPS